MTVSAARRLIRWVPRHPVGRAELGEEPELRALTPAGEAKMQFQLFSFFFFCMACLKYILI